MKHEGFFAFLTLLLAGVGRELNNLHSDGTLHYALALAQGLMYLASFAVGCITVYNFIKTKRNGHN